MKINKQKTKKRIKELLNDDLEFILKEINREIESRKKVYTRSRQYSKTTKSNNISKCMGISSDEWSGSDVGDNYYYASNADAMEYLNDLDM